MGCCCRLCVFLLHQCPSSCSLGPLACLFCDLPLSFCLSTSSHSFFFLSPQSRHLVLDLLKDFRLYLVNGPKCPYKLFCPTVQFILKVIPPLGHLSSFRGSDNSVQVPLCTVVIDFKENLLFSKLRKLLLKPAKVYTATVYARGVWSSGFKEGTIDCTVEVRLKPCSKMWVFRWDVPYCPGRLGLCLGKL